MPKNKNKINEFEVESVHCTLYIFVLTTLPMEEKKKQKLYEINKQ